MPERKSVLKLHSIIQRKLIMHLRKKIEPYGFSRGEFPFLVMLLKKGDGVSQKEICEDVMISKSTTSKMVNKLEREGYLRMEKDPDDKRVKRIYLTEKREEIEDIVEKIDNEVDEIMFNKFSEEDKEKYITYLEQILENVEEVVDR